MITGKWFQIRGNTLEDITPSGGGIKAVPNKPTILSPTSNQEIVVNNTGITVTSNEFSVPLVTDTHVATDWKICRDSLGKDVLIEAVASTDLRSHTFTVANCAGLTNNTTVYVFARYKGEILGYGKWSEPVAIIVRRAYTKAPTITAPTVNSTVYFNTGFTVTTSELQTDRATDTLKQLQVKVCSDANGNTVLISGTSNTVSKAFTAEECRSLSERTVYIFAKHVGTKFGESGWSTGVTVILKSGKVNTPSILTPANNAEILVGDGALTVTSNAFSTTPANSDTHKQTDWKLTSDAGGNTVIKQDLNTTDLTQHTFTGVEGTSAGKQVYAFAKYRGNKFGDSQWSSARSIKLLSGIRTPSGRTIYRHANNKGSVLEFDMFGKKMKLFVADAQYRNRSKQWGAYNKDSSLNNFSDYYTGTYYFYNSGGTYQSGATSTQDVSAYTKLNPVTDAQLQERFSKLSTDRTARANCDVWMTYKGSTDSQLITGVPAVEYCRGLTSFAGIDNCDVPNAYELSVIYIESDLIDSLDPTVSANLQMALSKQSNNYRWFNGYYVWSSTEYASRLVLRVSYYGNVGDYGKYGTDAVVPVREL